MSRGRQAQPIVVLITDPAYSLERTCAVVAAACSELAPGELAVQLRHKNLEGAALDALARTVRDAAVRAGATFVLSAFTEERLALAEALDVDGVHVPIAAIGSARDFAFVSTPAHSEHDVVAAASAGARAVLVSPIYPTSDREKGPPRGPVALTQAREHVGDRLRVYALGGVDPDRAAACAAAGADGVAAIRCLLGADRPGDVAASLAEPFRAARKTARV